ncbi:MAG: hypothetical protein A2Y38_25950 [Spirochaetes bacterium GWB1_59_5]|nr:MAG: hypothetical protein A2Y38_25950 [Spirochaetes bacterium GWB1_59_5]
MTAGPFSAGSAHLFVKPRLAAGFTQQLRTQLKSVNVEHKVSIVPNIAGFQQKLNTAVKSANANVKVGLKPDLTGFQTKLNAAVQGVNAPKIKVQVNPDITGFKSKLNAALGGVNTPTVRIKIAPNLAGFKTALNTQLATMGGTLKIKPDLDFTQANAQLATWRAAQGAVPLSLSVNLDTGAAMVQLATLRTMLRSIDLGSVGAGTLGGGSGSGRSGGGMIRRIRVQMELDRASVARAESELAQATSRMEQSRTRQADAADRVVLAERRLADATSRHGATSTQALAASQSLARAQRTLADRSGDAARFLGAQADAHRRLRQAQNDQNSISRLVRAGLTGIAESAINGATSLLSMVNPAGLVKTGLMALAGVSLIPLLGQLAQAAGVIALLPAMGAAATASIATIAVGSTGIMDAFKAAGEASASSAKDAAANAKKQADAARQVEDAERDVADARDNAAQTAKDGARQIAQAERQVQDAQERTKDAQEDLTRARKDAKEQIEDMNLALKGSAIDEEDALIALERARERLAELGKDGQPVTMLDRREAENNVRQAQQRIDEVRERNNDLRLETEAANKAGVEGAAQVVAAKEGVADAIQAEKDAQENLGVTQENVARQNAQAQRQIEDALRRVADAQANQAEALAETSSAVDKYNEALANLSPNARDFVEKTRALGDAWKELRLSVQDSLFDGMGAKMQELGGNYIPILTSGLTGLADVLNGRMRQAMDWLNGTEVQNDISAILDNTAEALGPLLDGLGNIGRALLDIATVGSELLPEVTGAFADGTKGFADTIREMRDNGELENFMREAMDTFAQIWRIIKNIGGITSSLFTGSDDLGESWLDSIEKATARWKEFLATPEGQEEIKKFFADVKAIVDGIVTAIKIGAGILGTFRPADDNPTDDPVLDPRGNDGGATGYGSREPLPPGKTPERLRPGAAGQAGTLRQGWDAADNSDSWIGKTARGFNSFFGFNNETDSYDGGMWNPNTEGTIADRVGDHFEEMGREWQVFTDKIGTTWETITGWVGNVKDSVVDLGKSIKEWVQDKASAAWTWLSTKVGEAREFIGTKIEELKTGISDLRQNIQDKVTDAIGWFTSLPTKIGEAFRTIIDEHFPWLGGALDTLSSTFDRVVNGIGSIWDGLKSKLASPINWVIDTVFNNGIVKFWNGIASKIGLPNIDPIGLIGDGASSGVGFDKVKAFARGGTVDGVMSGYSPGRDDRIIAVGGGEAVMRPEWTRAVGPDFVENANAAARAGGVAGARKFMGYFANGGIVESMEAVVRKHFPMLLTNDRAFSGLRFTDDGYHSKGMAGDFSNGGDAGTPEMKAFASYVADEYQNRTLELIHSPFDRNINNYKDVGDGFGFYGAGTMNQHRNHVHWAVDGPVGEGGAPDPSLWDKIKSGVGGAIGRVSTFFRNLVADQFEKPINALGSTIPNQFPGIGEFGFVPKKMYDTLTGKALDWVRGKAEAKDNAAGSTGSSGAPLGAFGGNSMDYAREIVEAAKERGLPSKAAKIALMTAMAESSLKMWANNSVPESMEFPHDAVGSDNDSVGLFQQRNGWGTVEQRMNPRASAGMFYDALMGVDWNSMSPAQAAQAVQRSAFADGSNYAAHEARADELVAQLYDAGGIIEPNKLAVNLSGKPEAVFTNDEWMLIHELVRLLGMTDFIDKLAATDGPKELSGEDITGLKSPYGTGAGTVAAGGYTLPTGELSQDLRAFDKLHGNQSSGAGGTGGSKFPAFGSPEHLQQAGAIFQNATSTFAGRARDAGMQFLSGWIPDELMNPQGLVGGLISADKELSGWFAQNHGTPDILNDPMGSLGQIAGGFIGGGTPPPMPTIDPNAVQQQVDSLRNNAPAQTSGGTTATGDTYHFHVSNVDEAFRRFQVEQAKKAATFIGR